MQQEIISKLFSSFTDLERAIESARHTLEQRGNVPKEVMQRLISYYGILDKQRSLASSLCDHLNRGNWHEVTRHVSLINGLSAMIRDDARSVLSSLVEQRAEVIEDESAELLM